MTFGSEIRFQDIHVDLYGLVFSCNTSSSNNVDSILDYKDVLQCVFYSEECKVDTEKAKRF